MKLRFAFLAVAALLWVGGSAAAQVVANPLITVDENGHGTIQFPGGGPIMLPGVLAPDPGPGGLRSALTYNLLGPPALIPGDVILLEPGPNTISDIIRFNPAGTGTPGYPASLVFYSDIEEPDGDLADTGFPTLLYTNVVPLFEQGPEGNNGITYTPNSDQPGFVPGFAVSYKITSDSSVPEPGSMALLAGLSATGALVAVRRVRRCRK